MAKEWMQLLRYIYKHKAIPTDTIYYPIVAAQGSHFANGIDEVFGTPNFNTPDYYLREVLKQNTWDFSVAKNYNDVIAINNLLLNEEGALRPWHDFKYHAQKIVGNSTRYLKTEYNTVVASAQMSRLWMEIQRDKHIFPFVQFDVVMDGHTSEICQPLNKVIVGVDDSMLLYYFPPNHFNCRTTVRKLRRGVPTAKYSLPKIPDAFKNNPGASGTIFTTKNRYIANTPQKVLELAAPLFYNEKRAKRYKGITFKQKQIKGTGLLEIFVEGKQTKVEFRKNKTALTILANNGGKYRMLPIVEDGLTNPDAYNFIEKRFIDMKVSTTNNGKNAIQNGLKGASKQGAEELVLHLTVKPKSYKDMYSAVLMSLQNRRNKNVRCITVIFPDNSIKTYDLLAIKNKQRLKE